VWQTQPDQQLMYHGVRVWARRHTPELMLGVYSPEEFDEPSSVPAKRPSRPAPLELAKPGESHDPETGEVVSSHDVPVEAAGRGPTLAEWEEYRDHWLAMLDEATPDQAQELGVSWNSDGHKKRRREIKWPPGKLKELMDAVSRRVGELHSSQSESAA